MMPELERLNDEVRCQAGSPRALFGCPDPPALFRHYPEGDCYDYGSHAQFYFHTHRQGERGHIHLFQRPKGMAPGLRPVQSAVLPDAACHLIAVELGEDGWPSALFTTNRWVTAEAWYDARSVLEMVAGLSLDETRPLPLAGRWLAALIRRAEPMVAELVRERDARLAAWVAAPGLLAFEDERLEVTSHRRFTVG